MTINNQRPGVYSSYNTSSAYTSARSAGYAAVVARAGDGQSETGVLYTFTSVAQLLSYFPNCSNNAPLRDCVRILLRSGVSRVYAVAVEEDYYEDALSLIENLDNVSAVVCDCTDAADLTALAASVQKSTDNLRERVAYCGIASAEDALTSAQTLNHERVVLCCPAVSPVEAEALSSPVFSAAAMAGRVLSRNDPIWNYNGEPLSTVQSPVELEENQIQQLLAAGVTVLEPGQSGVECIRAMTTRTQTGDVQDYSLRSLNAVLCIDNVMQSVRDTLNVTLRGKRLAGHAPETIRSQVAVVLADKLDDGIIESYETPAVSVHPDDPTVCVVELAFGIAHVVSQIHITAHIQV